MTYVCENGRREDRTRHVCYLNMDGVKGVS
jgi:hypothetical protein